MNGVAAAENAGAQVTDDSHGFTEFHHHHLLRDSLSVNTRFKMMISTVDSGFDSGSSPELHMSSLEDPPMSRTHQYRKVMKPLLERKRRARINKCLDDLKDLMVTALQSEGESITKLEKADVLELTVKHLQKLKRQNALGLTPQATYAGRFKAGYAHCAQEVSKYMSTQKNVNVEVTTRLFGHLGNCMQALESMPPSVLSMAVPPPPNPPASQISPVTPVKSYEEQIAPLDLIKNPGKENQAQDLSLKKVRNPLTNVNEKWRPW